LSYIIHGSFTCGYNAASVASIAVFTRFWTRPARTTRRAFFLRQKGTAMAKHRITAWRSWDEDQMRISAISRGPSMPLGGFTRDAAPVGSEVGGIGESSFGYAENNRTMRSFPQGKIGNTDPQRESDGAYRHVLARWKTGGEVEIVEDGDSAFLLLWEPPHPGEGRPQSAITADPITRSAVSGPEASAMQDAHRQMFDRIMDHNSKKPPVARRALEKVRQSADALESINEINRKFYGGGK
jgi:hypothetical protein